MKAISLRNFISIFFCAVIFLFCFNPPVQANQDQIKTFARAILINEYSRVGAQNNGWQCGVSAIYSSQCNGAGSWSNQASGIVYNAGSDSCSCPCGGSAPCSISWPTRYASPGDLSISRANPCPDNICVATNSDAPGSGGSPELYNVPSDPQFGFRFGGNSDSFLELVRTFENYTVNRIFWLHNDGSGDSRYTMIPTKLEDFNRFQSNKPSYITIQNACMPARFSLGCPSAPSCSCSCTPCPEPTGTGGGGGGGGGYADTNGDGQGDTNSTSGGNGLSSTDNSCRGKAC